MEYFSWAIYGYKQRRYQCHISQARILALPARTDLPQLLPTGTDWFFIKLLFLE